MSTQAADAQAELSVQEIYKTIPRSTLTRLQTLSASKMIGGLAFEWLGIIGAIALCERYFSWPLYVVAVFWISARILALGLVMHDGVHGLNSRNRALNDWVTECFAAWPIFISMRSYRVKHLAHHANLNTDQDPDWVAKAGHPDWGFPMARGEFFVLSLRLLTGAAVFSGYRVMSEKAALPAQQELRSARSWSYTALRAAYYLAAIGAIFYFGGGWLALKYWIVPVVTSVQLLNRVRRIAEHSGLAHRPLAFQTRTIIHGFWSRLWLSPKNIAFHNEHHFYPGVPLYRLPELHTELMKSEIARTNLHVTHSYAGLYHELVIA
jgi:fatty acid desaturase